jgi:hypothetical protein
LLRSSGQRPEINSVGQQPTKKRTSRFKAVRANPPPHQQKSPDKTSNALIFKAFD